MTGVDALAGLQSESLRHLLVAMISQHPEQRLSLEGCHGHFFTWRKNYKEQGLMLKTLGTLLRPLYIAPTESSLADKQYATRLAKKLDALDKATMMVSGIPDHKVVVVL